MNVNETISEISRQRNTLSYILQLLQKVQKEQVRLVTDNTFHIDWSRIANIKEFLELERDAVQAEIDALMSASVSGV